MSELRTYNVTVHFTDGRVKPRCIALEAERRSVARRLARHIARHHYPQWTIAQVTATIAPPAAVKV